MEYFNLLLSFFVGLDTQYPNKLWFAALVADSLLLAILGAAVAGPYWRRVLLRSLVRVPTGAFTSLLLMAKVALAIFFPVYFSLYVVAFLALALAIAIVAVVVRLFKKPQPIQQGVDPRTLAQLTPAPLQTPDLNNPAITGEPIAAAPAPDLTVAAAPVVTEAQPPAAAA